MMTTHPKRSGCLVTFITILLVYQTLNLIRVLQLEDMLGNSVVPPVPLQLTLILIWLLTFTYLLLGVVRKWRFALRYSGWLIITYILYRLLYAVLFVQADYNRQRLPFLLVTISLILIVPIFMLLNRHEE